MYSYKESKNAFYWSKKYPWAFQVVFRHFFRNLKWNLLTALHQGCVFVVIEEFSVFFFQRDCITGWITGVSDWKSVQTILKTVTTSSFRADPSMYNLNNRHKLFRSHQIWNVNILTVFRTRSTLRTLQPIFLVVLDVEFSFLDEWEEGDNTLY
jgi:hypothetical protein